MSNSLSAWICAYLLDIAGTYGEKFADSSPYPRKKKVQITKFLTYGSDTDENAEIWAEISDKAHLIPLRINKAAITTFKTKSAGQRLTQHTGAIASIKEFKVILATVPSPGSMTSKPPRNSSFALECGDISILGSSGESTFGNPEPILECHDIKLWLNDLKRSGGSGRNILKHKKPQEDKGVSLMFEDAGLAVLPSSSREKAESCEIESKDPYRHITRQAKIHTLSGYNAYWKSTLKNSNYFRQQPDAVNHIEHEAEALEIRTSPKSSPAPSSPTGSVISGWEPSPEPVRHVIMESAKVAGHNVSLEESDIPSPTPAQRRKTPTVTPATPAEPESSYPSVKETPLEVETVLKNVTGRARKIPRPVPPEPPKQSGPARVLAPNSDTSGSQSQPSQVRRIEYDWTGECRRTGEVMARTVRLRR
ncbi:hypothetical protein CPC08DRAFT_363033 [Agrocybe pediades]|nr:hypothetical protein CPC08DRAFT_363033 [Agrocybe pediades]